MSTKLKPFDLEAALRGEPVVTRDGRPVTQVTKFNVKNSRYCIAAVVDGDIETYNQYGKWQFEPGMSNYDIFMATKTVKKEGWVNLYKAHNEKIAANTSQCHKTKEAAEKNALPDCITTVKIEWEEEI